ncbi:hypothetical protein P4050_14740 [Pseudomonas aeruginosa]|nr:hypothetical protein [Pseudomonas aeruginosa]
MPWATCAPCASPFADAEHVTILRDSSNKEPAQKAIAAQYDVLLMLGDNLNDFQRRYYVDDVMQRNRLLDEDHKAFGEKYRDLPQSHRRPLDESHLR